MYKPPRWFVRQLECIDPQYSVILNEEGHTYDVLFYNAEQKETRIVARFRTCNDRALEEMRYRKWLGRQLRTPEGPDRLMKKMDDEKKEQKEKQADQIADTAAHELKDIYDTSDRSSVS